MEGNDFAFFIYIYKLSKRNNTKAKPAFDHKIFLFLFDSHYDTTYRNVSVIQE